jgi:phospholipid/cholesterol/gamma-HCH transport system substrate-binding protein
VRNTSLIGRVAAVVALVIAVIAVVLILLSGGSSYHVYAVFQDASQLVTGDEVDVAQAPIGTISNIALTPNGMAKVQLNISDSHYQPLRKGTIATVRVPSLSSVANRYVELRLAPGNAAPIHNGGTIGPQDTNSAVNIDEIFNTLNAPTRKGLQDVIQGSASQWKGQVSKVQAAWKYLNPAVAASSVLFEQINHNTKSFTDFLVKTGHLMGDIASRQADLTGLVQHLSTTTGALAKQHIALGESIRRLPGFMRLANTTFVNLRSALDALTPLVNASKPVAPKLRVLLDQLKPLAINSVPTVISLSKTIHKPGSGNDLIDMVRLGVPLADATVRPVFANGKNRPGAFPESVAALEPSTKEFAFDRPYAVDLTGWFEGYSHPGGYDANGGYARIAPVIGAFSVNTGGTTPPTLVPLPLPQRKISYQIGQKHLRSGQGNRCPGSMERGGVWDPYPGMGQNYCNPKETPH